MPKHNRHQYSLKEQYAFYKKESKDPVDYKTYKKVLELWGEKARAMLLEGKSIKLHSGMSTLVIRKRVKKTYIDKKASKDSGKPVRLPNTHSDFFGARVLWRRHYTRFNSAGWTFYPCRKLQRSLAAIMLQPKGHTRYLQQASTAGSEEQARSLYKKNLLKL